MLRALAFALLLLVPTAGAWGFQWESGSDDVSLTDSPLVAGALRVQATGGRFGSPQVDVVAFGRALRVEMCPDSAGEPSSAPNCPDGEITTEASLFVLAGGFVVVPASDAAVTLDAPAAAGALGGPNVTVNRVTLGPAAYVGGASVMEAEGDRFDLRPVGEGTSIEVRGDQGFRRYNGTAYTLRLQGAEGAHVESRLSYMGGQDLSVEVRRAPLGAAERGILVDDLFRVVRSVQPPESADRRADLAEAFGPFQLVPALLNGGVAGRANVTLDGEARDGFTFVRVDDLRLGSNLSRWSGAGNATYLVEGDVISTRPGAGARFPLAVPVILVGLALLGRAVTLREAPPRGRRRLAALARVLGFVLLALVAAAMLSPLLGFSPLLDGDELAQRSRVQFALVVAGMAAVAYLGIGLPVESLMRTAFAQRARPAAVAWPAAIGVAAALGFVLVGSATLLAFVARYVRL